MSYEISLTEQVLRTIWQSPVPLTMSAIGEIMNHPSKNVAAIMSNLKRVPEIAAQLEWDKDKTPASYSLKKGVPIEDLVKFLSKSNKVRKVVNGAKALRAKVGKQEIYAGPFVFPKGMAVRVTGDFVLGGIAISCDAIFEIVEGGKHD